MKNTKALQSFSINNRTKIKLWLLLLLVSVSTPSYTCGPEYDSLGIDMISNIGFDPGVASTKDVGFLWYDLVALPFYQKHNAVSVSSKTERQEIFEFEQRLTQAFSAAGRKLKIPMQSAPNLDANNAHFTLVDIQFPADGYSWGICASNNRAAYLTFVEAAIADKAVTDADLIALIALRSKLMEVCSDAQDLNDFKQSLLTKTDSYHRYLLAISHFYSAEFEQARAIFTDISQLDHSLSEVSLYLIGRTYLRENQPLEEYEQEFADASQQDRARSGNLLAAQAFESYLMEYPSGLYAKSAQGLIRRAQWFSGNQDAYAASLQAHIDQRMKVLLETSSWSAQEQDEMEQLIGEYQRFMAPETNQLQALVALLNVVKLEDAIRSDKHQALVELKKYIALHKQFQQKKYPAVIQSLSHLHNYREPHFLLLTRALEENGNWQEAIALWREVRTHEESYSLSANASNEIARILVAQGGIEKLIRDKDFDHPKADWLWETNRIKRNYLSSLCGTDTQLTWLKDDAINLNSRNALVTDIATRYLYAENFIELDRVFSAYSDDVLGGFSSIRTAVRQVAQHKQLGKAYMNIGYFMQTAIAPIEYLPGALRVIDPQTGEEIEPKNCAQATLERSLGSAGPYYYYNRAMRHFGDGKSVDEAKTLHFLTTCFKVGSAYSYSCLWGHQGASSKAHPVESNITSEQAFRRLHKKYPGTEWAKKTPYHY